MTNVRTSTLRPGIMVRLSTQIRGNVSYSRSESEILDDEALGKLGQKAKLETERTIKNVAEHEASRVARSKATGAIRKVCKQSAGFGLLCPEADEAELDAAIAEAREIEREFNATATVSRFRLFVLKGRIAPNDIDAVRSINSEIAGLLDEMRQGVGNADVKAVREAAARAKGIAEMLSTEARLQAEMAIDAARKAAREYAKAAAVEGGGEVRIDQKAIRSIDAARMAFLDLDDAPATAPVAARVAAPALDLSE